MFRVYYQRIDLAVVKKIYNIEIKKEELKLTVFFVIVFDSFMLMVKRNSQTADNYGELKLHSLYKHLFN